MLEIAEAIMVNAGAIIAANGLTDVTVTDAHQNLADARIIVTCRQQTDVHNTRADRRQGLHRLCCGVSEHAVTVKGELRTSSGLQSCTDGSAKESDASRQTDAPTTQEIGHTLPSYNARKRDASRRQGASMTRERGRTFPSGKRKQRRR